MAGELSVQFIGVLEDATDIIQVDVSSGPRGYKGDEGDEGPPGQAATISVASTTTIAPGNPAEVTNVGTAQAASLAFQIPQGDKGDKGDKGDTGDPGTTDHGLQNGLDDDDHSQYALSDGSRGNFATTAQGTKADSAVQPGDLAAVATTGDYGDLNDLPTLGTAAATNAVDYDPAGSATDAVNTHIGALPHVALSSDVPVASSSSTGSAGSATTSSRKDHRHQVTPANIGAVNKSGDTMTGALTIQANSPTSLAIDRPGGNYTAIRFLNNGADDWRIQRESNSDLRFYKAGGPGFVLTLGADGSIQVPAPTAANQAAQVTAIDPATGRLAIGGIEMGDTGWRDVSSLLVNGWTATYFQLKRTGSVVRLRWYALSGASATNDVFMGTVPTGFTIGNLMVRFIVDISGSAIDYALVQAQNTDIRNTGRDITAGRAEIAWSTDASWPTSLPGTAV